MNMAQFAIGLKKLDRDYERRDLMTQEEIREISLSKIMSDLNKSHPTNDELDNYSVERRDTTWANIIVQRPGTEPSSYTMKKNRFSCNSALCLVRCELCPNKSPCAHEYTCTCPNYSYRNICKHIHLLALLDVRDPSGGINQDQLDDTLCEDHSENEETSIEIEDHSENGGIATEIEDRFENVPISTEIKGFPGLPKENAAKNEKEEVSLFLKECDRMDEKTRGIKNVLRSNNYPMKDKKILMDAFRKPFANVLNTSPFLNPQAFPRLDRKRVHEPQCRSFFPKSSKKSRKSYLFVVKSHLGQKYPFFILKTPFTRP